MSKSLEHIIARFHRSTSPPDDPTRRQRDWRITSTMTPNPGVAVAFRRGLPVLVVDELENTRIVRNQSEYDQITKTKG